MDKYEYKVRSDEIKSLIGQGNYAQAVEIADTIDWRRVKSVMMLCTVSDLYKINRRYEDAKNMLLLAYERRPGGRTICYSLCELCIKTEEFMQALKYYKEFVQVAPKDMGRYILQYKLYEAQEVSLEERIGVLEELKKRDYREKWAYELAYLYHRMGLATRCVEECDELILWFGDGKYVVKAMELKMLHQPLTAAQQEVYDRRFEEPAQEPEQQDGYGEEADYGQQPAEGQEYGWPSEEERLDGDVQESAYSDGTDFGQEQPEDELEIQVKTVDVGQYNTINLQAELAAGLQEVLGADGRLKAVGAAEAEGFAQGALLADALGGAAAENGYQDFGEEEIEDSEVFFGATGELEDASLELESEYNEIENGEEPSEEDRLETGPEDADRQASEGKAAGWAKEEPLGKAADGKSLETERKQGLQTAEKAEGRTSRGDTGEDENVVQFAERYAEKRAGAVDDELSDVQPPREMADVLSQEANGQISIVLPENAAIEKQITGQMKLEDILTEWERIKKENEAKCQEEVRKHVLSQTGPMFTEFEATVRDGLLEQLEKGEAQGTGGREQAAGTGAAPEGLTGAEEAYGEPEGLTETEAAGELPVPEDRYTEADEMYAGPVGVYGESEELPEADEAYVESEELSEPDEAYVETEELPEPDEAYVEAEELLEPEEAYGEAEELPELEDIEAAEEAAYDTDAYGGTEELTGLEDEYAEPEPEEMDPEETAYDTESEEIYEMEPQEEPVYDAEAEYPAEDGFGGEAGYDEAEYIEENPAEIGFDEEPESEESRGELEYIEEAAYEEELAGYEDENAYAEEDVAVLESGENMRQDSKDDIQEDDFVEEIEEIQDQVEQAEEKKQPIRGGRPKKGKAENESIKDDKTTIEREQAKVRSLTREEKELFAPFIQNRRSREQLVKALDSISMAAYTGNLIITGEEGMDTLTLAKNMMREIRMIDSNFAGKVAKVSGQGLNEKDVAETLRQLNNGALIVQKASGMSGKTAAMLHKQLQHERFGIIVVLEDTEKAMKKLFLGTPDLYGDFTARVDLEALSNDTLVAFGRQYAREKEYSIDNLGVLALHTRIEELQTIDHVVTVMEVKQIVDEAIRRASKKSLGHFFDILLARRYDDEDMVILTEKDFAA